MITKPKKSPVSVSVGATMSVSSIGRGDKLGDKLVDISWVEVSVDTTNAWHGKNTIREVDL